MLWFFSGVISLAVLDAVVSSPAAGARAGGLLAIVAKGVSLFIDPTVPGIPDHSKLAGNGNPSTVIPSPLPTKSPTGPLGPLGPVK